MKGRRLVLLSAIVVAIIIGGWIIQKLRLESGEQPVTEADLRILQRADVLLKDPASWNHDDDRLCDDDERPENEVCFAHSKRPIRMNWARTNIETSRSRKFVSPSKTRRVTDRTR